MCKHSLEEKETACFDGMCPMCLADDLDKAKTTIAELKFKLGYSIQFNPSARVIHGGKRGQSDLETIVMNYGTRKAAEKLARLYELAGEKAGKEFAEWMKESEEE